MIPPLEVHYRDDARSDLDTIFWYIAQTSADPRTAFAYVKRLEERCRKIGEAPRTGRIRDDLSPGLRTVAFERSAIVCYLIEDQTVWITNIFRRGRNFEAVLRGETPESEND
jgi:toxin ParE1/3/4